MLVRDIYKKILALIDSYTEEGIEISSEENIDIEKKVILFSDMAQKELWNYNKNTKQIELTNTVQPNALGLLSNFNLVDFHGETQYYPNESGVKNVQGYSIKVDGDCTLTYQENVGGTWTNLKVIMPTNISELTLYKGVLAVSNTNNPVRLKIDGTTHFRHKDRALWEYLYQDDKVPTYGAWIKYELPDDFNSIDAIIEEYKVRQYTDANSFKLENNSDFYFNFYFDGIIRITYKPIPSTITSLDDTIMIDDVLAQTIVYDVVSKLGFIENNALVNWGEDRRMESKQEAIGNQLATEEIIQDYYE